MRNWGRLPTLPVVVDRGGIRLRLPPCRVEVERQSEIVLVTMIPHLIQPITLNLLIP